MSVNGANQESGQFGLSDEVTKAVSIFEYLKELKKLQTTHVRDVTKYEQVLWIADVPRDTGCFCRAWDLVQGIEGSETDRWVEIKKPSLKSPPEVPDGIDPFIRQKDLENSSEEVPKLLEVSNEILLKHFVIKDEDATERQVLNINDNLPVFDQYIDYIEKEWAPWAHQKRSQPESSELPPNPPEAISSWIKKDDLPRFELEQPGLEDEITVEIDRRIEKARKELEVTWDRYLQEQWKPWAEEDRRLKKIQNAYNSLFAIYQKQQKLGEQYEVIYGFGLLAWDAPATKTVKRHLVAVPASMEFDAKRGVITVGPSADFKKPNLETDYLEINDLPTISDLEFVMRQVVELDNFLWDQAKVYAALSSWTNSLSIQVNGKLENRGQFLSEIKPLLNTSSIPMVTLAPALILRKRSSRGMIDFIDRILENLKNESVIPKGLAGIISTTEDQMEGSECEGTSIDSNQNLKDSDIYFPLPSNKEQKEIINHLNKGPGVLVQGPPGTGKSHTIANLICHFLATGKKVLVTSQTPRALQSLRSKFTGPAARLSDLAVVLLGNDEEGFQELEKSVLAITNKRVQWNAKENKTKVEKLRSDLHTVRIEIQTLQRALREAREQDVYEHHKKFGTFSGTAQKIAINLRSVGSKYNWLLDTPDNNFDATDLKNNAVHIVKRWQVLKPHLLPTAANRAGDMSVPKPQEFADFKSQLDALGEKYKIYSSATSSDIIEALCKVEEVVLEEIRTKISSLRTRIEELYKHVYSWVPGMVRQVLAEQDRIWSELQRRTASLIKVAESSDKTFLDLNIETVKGVNLKDAQREAVSVLDFLKSGKGLGFSWFRSKELKRSLDCLKGVTYKGNRLKTAEEYEILVKCLESELAFVELKDLWQSVQPIPHVDKKMLIAACQDYLEPLEAVFSILEEARQIAIDLKDKCILAPPRWYEVSEINSVLAGFNCVGLSRKLKEAEKVKEQWLKHSNELPKAIFNNLGSELGAAIASVDTSSYGKSFELLEAVVSRQSESHELLQRMVVFSQTLPKTYKDFCENCEQDDWIDRFVSISDAIGWKLADGWLTEISSPAIYENLAKNIADERKKEARLLGEISELMAWDHCMGRLKENQRQALAAWHQAVKKIGKGYSKHVELYRKEAREKLAECRSAIPAWVMPIHRLVETIPAQPEIFDVVIIDEASQSGPEALILNYIGKQIIVVGDDQQIRPEYDFTNLDNVRYLINRHLKDIKHSESFDTNGSFFSQAELRLSKHVRLKEHFRCMPEIIQFSNTYMYSNDPLIPLRQYGSGRLQPVTRTTFVEGGYRTGKYGATVNQAEAEAIVRQICECCEDPEFENKTMGVIVLLGQQQATLIQELLIEELDSEEFEKRQLLIGSPYMFQGDERDVIFISMVEAPEDGRRSRAVTRPEDYRSYNVAASRARDVLWLFHSVSLNDLKPECLRYKLIAHVINPSVQQSEVNGIAVEDLRKLAHSQDRERFNQPEPFESWFEVDIYLAIASRGYRVVPQYKVSSYDSRYRIDLVVEGLNGRLAVECDGDKWHGPDQYESDCARERELQRCGWNFWRVKGAAYYRNPERSLESLWEELDKLKIFSSSKQAEENQKLTEVSDITQAEFQDDDTSEFEPEQDSNEQEAPSGVGLEDLSSQNLQDSIVSILRLRPNNSIALKALPKEVLNSLGVRTRGGPRLAFEKRIRRALGVLKRRNLVEEYRSKNLRIRLISADQAVKSDETWSRVLSSLESLGK